MLPELARRGGLALVTVAALAACADDPTPAEDLDVVDDVDVEDRLYGDFFVEPDQFIGDEVTVAGEVSAVVTDTAFLLDGVGPGANVLGLTAAPSGVAEDEVVKVIGEADELDIVRAEEELGRDLDDDVFDPYSDEGVILASSVDE